MKFHVLVCFLLISVNFVAVIFVSCTNSTRLNSSETEVKLSDKDRWQLEIDAFPKGLKVPNEEGLLVELTADDSPPTGSARRGLGNEIYFYLYTKNNRIVHDQLTVDTFTSLSDLQWSNYNYKNPTYFVTHGWLSNGGTPACTLIRDAYLENIEANVIIVDWGNIAFSPYGWAVKQVEVVAEKVANMIKFLIEKAGTNPADTTLIGHSLGAHVMGIAGNKTNGTIGTIIGLDPAFPLFSLATVGSRISNKDAKYVQIIHTNGGLLGIDDAIGHTDFYPDGGTNQLSCSFDLGGSCSHVRAYEFFAESVNTTVGFYARPCKSKVIFLLHQCEGPNTVRMGGITIDPNIRGSFYLWLNKVSPYAKGIDDKS